MRGHGVQAAIAIDLPALVSESAIAIEAEIRTDPFSEPNANRVCWGMRDLIGNSDAYD